LAGQGRGNQPHHRIRHARRAHADSHGRGETHGRRRHGPGRQSDSLGSKTMKFADLKVRTRLFVGFSTLLVFAVIIAVFSQRELSHLEETVHQLTTEDWDTITLSNGLRTDVRGVSARVSEFLMSDPENRAAVRAKLLMLR